MPTVITIDSHRVKVSSEMLGKVPNIRSIIEKLAGTILIAVPSTTDLRTIYPVEERVEYIPTADPHRILGTPLHGSDCCLQILQHLVRNILRRR
jgi:hypothetical protein